MRQYREPVDVCVNYIDSLLVLAAKNLPDVIEKPTTELGRITRPIALAVRAKLWVTAASPLFNGNTDYANIIDNKGRTLFPQTVDPKNGKRLKMPVAKLFNPQKLQVVHFIIWLSIL